jgi:phenylalanyl-tRNA synthetase beta chain
MKFTLNWLKEYVGIDLPVAELADRLTMLGLEVDNVTPLGSGIEQIRIGRVLAVKPHPNADRLTVCEVEVDKKVVIVVCGAPNVRPGLLVPVALPGTTLSTGLLVKEAVIRGEKSQGMLCSEKELGISDDHSGIMELPTIVDVEKSLVEALNLADTLIEVDLTPNRPDCASVIGIAREVAGFTGQKLQLPLIDQPSDLNATDVPFDVEIRAETDCPRYGARLLKNITIGPSPWWLQKRLTTVGLRSINNIVDITNLVMLEYGQPLHAFDFHTLAGGKIVVRHAAAGEKFTTLDGAERDLDAEMLLICDAEKPVAIAGIMGGLNSEVSEATTDVLLESAYFNPVSIRRTARRLNMATDASYRFERGVDPEGVLRAMERAVQLMVEIAGAEVVPGGVDRYPGRTARPSLRMRVRRTSDLLGVDLSGEEIAALLRAIEMRVKVQDDKILIVEPPSFRVDIEREIDLVEEVARLIGFNEIPSTLPSIPMSFPDQDKGRDIRQRIVSLLTGVGFSEAVNYSFVSAKHFDKLGLAPDDPARRTVRLLNPLSEDQGIMRTLLLPGLLENVQRNVSFQTIDIKLFETGKVFLPAADEKKAVTDQPVETPHVTAVLSGRRYPESALLHYGIEPMDILDVKGTVELLCQELRLSDVVFVPTAGGESTTTLPYVAEDTQITVLVAGDEVGILGQVNPSVLRSFGIKQDVYFFDLNLDAVALIEPDPKSFQSLPRFPAVHRDIAMLVPEGVPAGDIVAAVKNSGNELLDSVELFDIYRGKSIETGFKSVALAITYRSDQGTLDDRKVDMLHQKIISLIESEFSGRLREANV